MKKTIKTLALIIATIGVTTVIKQVKKQSDSNKGIKAVTVDTGKISNTSDYIRDLWEEGDNNE